jgi:hypothetical protein
MGFYVLVLQEALLPDKGNCRILISHQKYQDQRTKETSA